MDEESEHQQRGREERGEANAHTLGTCSMASITSAVATLRRHAALCNSTKCVVLSRASGAAVLRAAASTLVDNKADSYTSHRVTNHISNVHRPIGDVVVVGAGIAGLATAACLGRLGIRMTVAAAPQKKETSEPAEGSAGAAGRGGGAADKKTPEGGPAGEGEGAAVHGGGVGGATVDPGVGIWTHGLACLNELGILRRLEAEGRYMGVAGYRDAAGHWLATPSQPLQAYDATSKPPGGGRGGRDAGSGASVLFVRESKLIEALRSAVPADTTFIGADVDDISWGAAGCDNSTRGGDTRGDEKGECVDGGGGSTGHRGTASGRLCGGDGNGRDTPAATPRWAAEFDLLVGADGPDSFVRNEVMLASLGAQAAGAGAAAPERRGYVVYRGVCSSGSSAAAAAAVEADRGDGEEEGWGLESFQTWGPGLRFASVPLAGDERMWFATVADGVSDGGDGGGDGAPAGIKGFLLGHFGNWHAPIPSLIRATGDAGIAREDARAMSRRGLRAAAAAGPAARKAGQGVVLVGDAAHTLDPVLAQGAGVALEDAFFLARYVKDLNASAAAAGGPEAGAAAAAGDGRGAGEGLERSLARYDADRLERALLLSYLSDVSQTLGQLRRPGWLVRARDSSLARFVPSTLRSRIFDGLMSASLSGGLAGATAAAAGAATRTAMSRGGRGRFGGYAVPRL